jgi:cysteine-rich repeat protein
MLDPGEPCEGADLGGNTCQSLGFDTGTLTCKSDCTLETSACSGTETCQDGLDNDGDTSIDCADSDCTASCMDACAVPVLLADPSANITGNTAGHSALAVNSSCSSPGGPAIAYTFTAATTGFLDAELLSFSDANLNLSIRTACADDLSEVACSDNAIDMGTAEKVSIPINQNDTVYIVVSGSDAAQAGPFSLNARSRTLACGDGFADPPEECDDNDMMSGDGCSNLCTVEATEVETNNSVGTANVYSAPFYAAISPAGDEDFIAIAVPSSPSSLVASVEEITTQACPDFLLDSYIEILNTAATVVASNDDGGNGYCSSTVAGGLSAGMHYVRVRASATGSTPTFPYRLHLTLIQDVCGNGMITPSEQCDDGGTVPGDGCSATCQFELSETEPDNNSAASADPYASPWLANISPGGDIDYVAVAVPGPSSTLTAATSDYGTDACLANQLDSVIDILGPDGTTVLTSDDDSGPGYCSIATASGLAAGMYYVRIHSAPLVPNATFFYELNVTVQ